MIVSWTPKQNKNGQHLGPTAVQKLIQNKPKYWIRNIEKGCPLIKTSNFLVMTSYVKRMKKNFLCINVLWVNLLCCVGIPYVLTYFVNTMLWLYESFSLKVCNFLPSIIVDNLEHVSFWPLEHLWTTSHVLNSRFSCLYFQIRTISTFLRILHFRKINFTEHLHIFCLKSLLRSLTSFQSYESNYIDGQ